MPSAERTVTINRPAGDVFAFIADGTNAPQWRSGVLDIERTSGTDKDAVYKQGVKGPMGRRIAADYEVTVYEAAKRLEFKAVAGPVRPAGGYRLAESDGKTKLTFWLKAELGVVKRLVFGRSVQKTMDAEMQSLDKLKSVLEAGGKSAAAPSSASSSAYGQDKPAAANTTPAAKTATARTARRRTKGS